MDINATVIGQYMMFALLLPVIAYFLLRQSRQYPGKDALVILLLTFVPPLSFIALLLFYIKPNKQVW